jgi:hypothetical protein
MPLKRQHGAGRCVCLCSCTFQQFCRSRALMQPVWSNHSIVKAMFVLVEASPSAN